MIKKRLDQLLHERFAQYSGRQIQDWIKQGKATVEGRIVTKPGTMVLPSAIFNLEIEEPKFVSRAGFKIEKALDYFIIDVTGLIILDAGISTGGFTDCLLQRGAKKIYGIDVGHSQVHEKISSDPRVQVHERTNLRALTSVGELVDMVTLDLSFISILKVMDAVCALLKPQGQLVTLIKPQFQAQPQDIGRGGIIKSSLIHQRVIKEVSLGVCHYGFELVGVIPSPIEGSSGNKEFLAYFKRI